MLLHNTASEIHKLYARAAREEPHHAPNVQEAQDLNSYLHLWNVHKQEKSDLIRIAMKGWRPPAWAAEVGLPKFSSVRFRDHFSRTRTRTYYLKGELNQNQNRTCQNWFY